MFNVNNLETIYREQTAQTNLVNLQEWKMAATSKKVLKLPQLRHLFVTQKHSKGWNATPCCA